MHQTGGDVAAGAGAGLGVPVAIAEVRAFRADLRQLEREVERSLASETGCCGVTSAQCHLLMEVESRGKTGITDLAGVLELDKSTLSRTVDGMCRSGLLNRVTDPANRRRQLISLTAEGKQRADSINQLCDGSYRRLLERIPRDKRAMVMESVSLLARAMRRLRREPAGSCCEE
jgi:DNA-binding MarR family transcriptional regulator